MALSDSYIKANSHKDDNGKPKTPPYKLSDSLGLFLQVTKTNTKLWRFKYRIDGKEKLLSFGSYPAISLAQARIKRDEARKLIGNSIDPSEAKKAHKASSKQSKLNSFEVFTRLWLANHAKDLATITSNKNLRLFERDIFPWIGNKPITDLKPLDILTMAKRIESRGAIVTAKRAIQICGQVFRQAVIDGFITSDPTRDIRQAIKPAKDKHFASLTDPKEVAELLRAIDAFKGSFVVMCAVRLAPLVFVRPGELRKAKWSDIDLNTGEWRYLVTKTNTDHLVPLATQAIEILKELQPVTGHYEYVFQVGNDPKKPMSDGTINAVLKRMGYDTQTQITGHGFRAMARTILHERLSIDPHIIEHQLAHVVPDNLGGAYNRTKFIDQRKVMMQEWADYLDKLRKGAEIVPFKKNISK